MRKDLEHFRRFPPLNTERGVSVPEAVIALVLVLLIVLSVLRLWGISFVAEQVSGETDRSVPLGRFESSSDPDTRDLTEDRSSNQAIDGEPNVNPD